MNDNDSNVRRGAGGTPGGLLEFFVGVPMVILGCYLFFNNLVVQSSLSALWGHSGTGLALLILLLGIGVLFFNGRSWLSWLLVGIGIATIFLNVLSNLTILFRPTNFFQTVLMLGLIFGGLGLVARALRPH